jgi:hypothetical protein
MAGQLSGSCVGLATYCCRSAVLLTRGCGELLVGRQSNNKTGRIAGFGDPTAPSIVPARSAYTTGGLPPAAEAACGTTCY